MEFPTPIYRQDNNDTERDKNCEQYINEVLAIIYEDEYFDTRLSKASRIAFVAKQWGAIGNYHAGFHWCNNCEKQYKPDDLTSDGRLHATILCHDCKFPKLLPGAIEGENAIVMAQSIRETYGMSLEDTLSLATLLLK